MLLFNRLLPTREMRLMWTNGTILLGIATCSGSRITLIILDVWSMPEFWRSMMNCRYAQEIRFQLVLLFKKKKIVTLKKYKIVMSVWFDFIGSRKFVRHVSYSEHFAQTSISTQCGKHHRNNVGHFLNFIWNDDVLSVPVKAINHSSLLSLMLGSFFGIWHCIFFVSDNLMFSTK